MNIKRIFCADCYEWKELADLESFPEKTGNWTEHKGCEVYVRDCCYKVLNSYEEFIKAMETL